jgi:hypothetical protein
MTRQLACLCLLATFSTVNVAADTEAGPWRPLLDAKLSSFDVYLSYHGKDILGVIQGKAPKDLKPIGLNPKDQNVFSVSEEKGKPLLRISGEFYGCLQTREEFSNYHLRLETRWGGKKWVPRLDEPKDSGILYHSRGPFGVDYWTFAPSRRRRARKRHAGIPRRRGWSSRPLTIMHWPDPTRTGVGSGTSSSWCVTRPPACTSSTAWWSWR